MKFYETHFEDYCKAIEKHNIHPELEPIFKNAEPRNWIFYGPTGVGKYSQVLHLLKQYSPSQLKYDKKIKVSTDKQSYKYRISDIHYEIDMSLLGCNSKILWHEIYSQIVDIITIKPEKIGFIVCKNFHCIHNELLEIFYSYMQKFCHGYEGKCREVQIYFILVTEHISFLPNNILDHCSILHIGRPNLEHISACCQTNKNKETSINVLKELAIKDLINLKEVYSFSLLKSPKDIPPDHFNTVCDSLIQEMLRLYNSTNSTSNINNNETPPSLTQFRDLLYDILIYNLDGIECIWYIYQHFVKNGYINIESKKNKTFMKKLITILKQFGNNYRSIFHLENAIFSILEAIE